MIRVPDNKDGIHCKWSFKFSKKSVTINTLDEHSNCGFGFGVYADGIFKQKSTKIVEYFKRPEGEIIYFKDLK